jgi:hypothetical protein
MYVRLTPNAREMLNRSREFKRGVDNTVYHKGYPINYREQHGTPSIQISIAMDGRLADVDVDYRASFFPSRCSTDPERGELGRPRRRQRRAARRAVDGVSELWRSFRWASGDPCRQGRVPAFALPGPARRQDEHQRDGA